MGHHKKRLDPVLENVIDPPITSSGRVISGSQYCKPHKYGSRSKGASSQCSCLSSPFSFFVKLRDRYIKAMNDMATGGADFTGVTGYHAWADFDYTLQQCKSGKERHLEG